jgi:iron complex outermembrane receptor protein
MFKILKIGGVWSLVLSSLSGKGDLEPMVVNALRLQTESKNLPAQVETIDQSAIKKSGSLDLVELLRRKANLQVRSTSANSARSTVSMGGFGENGQLRTLILLDGHRLNAIDMSAIDWYSIPIGLVESIEVIRGAHSGTYGNHAVGGVIKINTKLPSSEPRGALEISGGSFHSSNVRSTYSQMVGNIGLTVFGERAESDGYRVNGDHQTNAGGLRMDWGGQSDWGGYLSWSLSDSEFGLPGSLNSSQLLINRRQAGDPNNRVEERSSLGRAGLSYELNDEWKFENRLGYQTREVIENTPDWSWSSFTVKDYQSFACNPSMHYHYNGFDWMFGFDLSEDKRTGSDYSEFEKSASALLGSALIPIADELSLNGNFRLERAKFSGDFDKNKNEWAAGIGLIRDFGSEDRVYSTLRRFYRYPVTDEYYSVWTGLNPDLEPESGYEVEIGAEWTWETVLLSGRVFHQWMEGEIYFNGFQNANLSETRRLGFDLSIDWQMTDEILSGLSYEYVRATLEKGVYSGSKVPLVPEGLLRLFVEFRPFDSLFIEAGGSYVGHSFYGSDFHNSGSKVEDFWLHDLTVNYQHSERVSLFGRLENFMDEEYLSSSFAPGNGYPGEGRKAVVGLSYSF